MEAIVSIISRYGFRNEAHCRNQPNKSKLALYKPLIHFYSQLHISNNIEHFNRKGGCGVHECTRIKVFKRRAGFGYR